ncbi:MAG: ABC transporter substrate-binding protein [Opitutales bacterium]
MKKRRSLRLNLWLLVLAYVGSIYWVFTRSAPLVSTRPVTIRIAHWQIERGPPDGISAAIKRYEELNPRVKVEQMLIPGAVYKQWLRTNLAGGTAADIMEWGAWLAGQNDVPARYFEPLTAELAKPNPYNAGTSQAGIPWEETFHDKLIGPRRDSPDPGQIYAVTVTETSVRLFCNADLLRKITGHVTAPATFNDFRKVLAQVQAYAKRTGQAVNGLAGSRDNGTWIAQSVFVGPLLGLNYQFDDSGYLYLYNRQVLAAYLQGRWDYRRPEVKAGLSLVREVSQAMKPGYLQLQRDDAMREFFSGGAVFLFTGTWDATTIRRMSPFKIVAMRLPPVTPDDPEVGRYVMGIGGEGRGETSMALYVDKHSPHRAEAIDFLRFLTSVPGNQLFTDHSLWLPAVNGVKVPEEIQAFRSYQVGYALGQAPYSLLGSESAMMWDRYFYKLTGDQGGVDQFADALDQVEPAAIRKDLEDEMRNTLLLVKPQDAQIVAYAELAKDPKFSARGHERQAAMEAGQTMSEGLAFQLQLQLRETQAKPTP